MSAPRSVTLKDVALAAGVHTASVSRALRGVDKRVSLETRLHIQKVAQELGYRPNAAATTLRTRRSNLVGILVPDLGNPLFGPLVTGLELELRARGLMCLVVHPADAPAERRDLIATLATQQICGFLILTAERSDPMLEAALAHDIPTVLVNRTDGSQRFATVVNDDFQSVRLILEHLAELGHRRIAHVAGSPASSTSHLRRQAFDQVCGQLGLQGLVVQASTCTREGGFAAADASLQQAKPGFAGCSAIFAANDMIAMGVLDALRRHGRRVPDDVSLVGHNDMPLVDLVTPPLTTVRVAIDAIAREAIGVLRDLMEPGGDQRPAVLLEPTLVVRGSTARPAKGAAPASPLQAESVNRS